VSNIDPIYNIYRPATSDDLDTMDNIQPAMYHSGQSTNWHHNVTSSSSQSNMPRIKPTFGRQPLNVCVFVRFV
jgi:hypothetical protein